MTYDILLKNGNVVTPCGQTETDIAIKDGKIVGLGNYTSDQAAESHDCRGLTIMPGVIDTQVHFREPGGEQKECLETGMKAALLGGVTSIFEMPNTNPTTTTPEALQNKLDSAARTPFVNYAFYFGASAENADKLGEWENLPGVCGIKIFMGSSTGSLLVDKDADVRKILQNGKRIVAVHAEDEEIMRVNKESMNPTDVTQHPVWRSVESSVSCVSRVVRLARETGRRVHVLHITAAEEMEILRKNKDLISVEVLPNHLTLHAPECYARLGTLAQQNPPIREKHHQKALWDAIADGTVDMIGSDHAPHTLEEKQVPYPKSPSGTPGVQTLLPIMLNHVYEDKLSLERLVELLCHAPQRVHGIAGKGRIEVGYDADLTLIDLHTSREIKNEDQASRAGWSPYDGDRVHGWPIMTFVNGVLAMREDQIIDGTAGQMIHFKEAFPA